METHQAGTSPELVLVVDDDPTTLECLVEAVQVLGLSVCAAEDGEQALQLFDQQAPTLVVTDVRMPKMDGLTLTQQIKSRKPECPVVIVTGYGDESTAVAALKAGASDYLHKPFQLVELKDTINRSLSFVRARIGEEQALRSIHKLAWHFEVENDLECLGGLLTVMLRPVDIWLSETQRLHIRMGLQELLINAVEHGNLGISSGEKQDALMNDTYDQLFEARRRDPYLSARRVKVWMDNDPDQNLFHCRILDEGAGFDWQQVINASQDSLPMMMGSGRGIFLAKTLMPELHYLGQGNEVTLTVRYTVPSEVKASC